MKDHYECDMQYLQTATGSTHWWVKPCHSLLFGKLRHLCQTMGAPYSLLIADLDKTDVVELSVAYGTVQTLPHIDLDPDV